MGLLLCASACAGTAGTNQGNGSDASQDVTVTPDVSVEDTVAPPIDRPEPIDRLEPIDLVTAPDVPPDAGPTVVDAPDASPDVVVVADVTDARADVVDVTTAPDAGVSQCLAAAAMLPATPRFAFASERDGNFEVYTMNANGTGLRRLTFDSAADDSPFLSRDGTLVVFESDRNGGRDKIFTMRSDGTDVRQITSGEFIYFDPELSGDNNWIGYTHNTNSTTELYVVRVDGTGATNVSNAPDTSEIYATLSPDGGRVAYAQHNQAGTVADIYVRTVATGALQQLTTHPAVDTAPSFSPDGRRIAFTSARDGNNEIYVMNADGTGQTRLTNDPAEDNQAVFVGDRIAFVSLRAGNPEIFLMNADGTGQTNITCNPARDAFEVNYR